MMVRRIVLEDGQPPTFHGDWTVGEVLQMAEGLARWAQSLRVTPPAPIDEQKNEVNDGIRIPATD